MIKLDIDEYIYVKGYNPNVFFKDILMTTEKKNLVFLVLILEIIIIKKKLRLIIENYTKSETKPSHVKSASLTSIIKK